MIYKCLKWRRGSDSNRWIEVLQTSALPLGYRALSKNTNRRILAAASESQSNLLLRLGFDDRLGGVNFTLNLTNTTLTFGSCSKLLSHNGEGRYQRAFPVSMADI